MKCGQCGATARAAATYCEMCGAIIPVRPVERTRHGLTGTGITVVSAASTTGLAIIVGLAMLIHSLLT